MFPNLLDYTLLTYLIACYMLSSLRAGPKQLFTFGVLVISLIMTGNSYDAVSSIFPPKVFPDSFAGAFGFLVTFLIIFGLLSLAGRLFDDFFKRVSFGVADAFIAKGIGILKGLLLGCMTVVVIMVNYPLDEAPVLYESVALPYMMPVVKKTVLLLPKSDQKLFTETEKELKMEWTLEAE